MKIPNIDNCEPSDRDGEYGGASGMKDGVLIDGEYWIVKYPKNAKDLARHEELFYTLDPVSEYIGSHIYEILGYPVHETMFVERKGKLAVACKDFRLDSQRLVEIRTIKNSANEKLSKLLERDFNSTGSTHWVKLDEIKLHLKYNNNLTKIDGVKDRFWDMIVIDGLINNSDRNDGNWGVIREKGKKDILAPIFDNGGSFNGKTPDSRLKRMLENSDMLIKNALNGNSTYCDKDEKVILFKDIINDDSDECKNALLKNVPLIKEKMLEITKMINDIPDFVCSPIRKQFYIQTMKIRYEQILVPAYEKAISKVPVSLDERIAQAKKICEKENAIRKEQSPSKSKNVDDILL